VVVVVIEPGLYGVVGTADEDENGILDAVDDEEKDDDDDDEEEGGELCWNRGTDGAKEGADEEGGSVAFFQKLDKRLVESILTTSLTMVSLHIPTQPRYGEGVPGCTECLSK